MRIDLIENFKSQFGVLNHFEKCLQSALRDKNIASRTLSLKDGESAWIEQCSDEFPDWTIGFNVMPGLAPHFETHGIHHIAIVVDAAPYFPELYASPSAVAAFVDLDSARFFQVLGHKKSLFLPHAIEKEALLVPQEKERPYEVVFAGSFIDADAVIRMWQGLFSKQLQDIFTNIVEEALSSSEKSYLLLCVEAMQKHPNLVPDVVERGLTFFDWMTSVERVIRGRERAQIVAELHDCDLHLFGPARDEEQWKKYLKTKCTFHGPQTFDEMMRVYQRSRVVINSVPMFKTNTHERFLYALAGGGSVITNQSHYLQEQFPENSAVGYFQGPNYKKIVTTIHQMLQDEDKRGKEVEAARKIIAQNHTWDKRVDALLEGIGDKG